MNLFDKKVKKIGDRIEIPKETIYMKARDEGEWDIKYGDEGISFPFYFYEDFSNKIISFKFLNGEIYEILRNKLKRFYDENPQIKIIKFDKDRLLIPLSICEKIDLS